MPDIVLIGGGVIGLSIAYELATRGASVRVLDQGQLGQESSWAGAGMITPANPSGAKSPETRLRAESFVRWPDWIARLKDETGIDTGFARCGGIELSPARSPSAVSAAAAKFQSEGVRAELVHSRELRTLEPNLNPELGDAVYLPDYCQVRNPRLLRALLAACAARGVQLSPGSPVIGFERSGSRVTSVRTPTDTINAEKFVVCSGAWSQAVLAQAGVQIRVEPVRGQIVLLDMLPLPTRRIIEVGSRYIVPRADGHLLIGSTEDHVGFEKCNTAEAVAELIRFGCELIPSLKSARLERCWSGLRPGSPNGLPYLGQAPNIENLFIAAGHFRAGLMLSPITAVLLRQLLLNEELSLPDYARNL
ncbi:MAG: glycine oxidase [Planctomycetota bacterium]|nr:MAG: glycine oxidase [Planctomycetota bacterium]